jgi:hypothetical protein
MKSSGLQRTSSMTAMIDRKKRPIEPASQQARARMREYVEAHGGSSPIHTILIANNGMAATKAMLSLREFAFDVLGDAKALTFVAMASGQDLDANAEFVRLADRVVEVPSGSNKNNYANVELIIDVAEREAVDAVWPGWGHASEYPELPDGLAKRNITFIGPSGGPMRALGDKIAASILAQTARVSSIPWSGDGITCDPKVVIETGAIPPELFRRCPEQKMTFNVTVSPRRRRRDAASPRRRRRGRMRVHASRERTDAVSRLYRSTQARPWSRRRKSVLRRRSASATPSC